MTADPRLANALAMAQERQHPVYAAMAYRLARESGDVEAMQEALALGASSYRPEPNVYAHTEDDMLDQIVTGDARELARAIPDQSVDLIFSDLVYDRIADYAWLAKEAVRVLKPNRACLVWCSNKDQYAVHPAMIEHLRFVCQLSYTKVAKQYRMIGYKTFYWTTPLLWFNNGSKHDDHEWLIDTVLDYGNAVISTATPPTKTYKWHKNPEAYSYWLLRFTKPGDVVWDPFTGSGSLPLVCMEHGRHFIASEIMPEIADQARARIAAVQQQVRMLLPEQEELAL